MFDWEKEFPKIFSGNDPGFDVVIGNPPYIRIQALKEWAPREVEFYKKKYLSASKGNYDIYVVFVEKGLSLLNTRGRLGFILPHKFFNAQYGQPLRGLVSNGRHLAEVVHFGDSQVFRGATTYTCLMFLDKAGAEQCRFVRVDDLAAWQGLNSKDVRTTKDASTPSPDGAVAASSITSAEWNFTVGEGSSLFERLNRMPVRLENVTDRIFQGIKTSADRIYIVEENRRNAKEVQIRSKETEKEHRLEPDLLHPLVKGGDSKRYRLSPTNRLILFPYAPQKGGGVDLIPESTLKEKFPLTWAYLIENKPYLENRENRKMRGPQWYAYGRNQALDVMPLPKIFTPDIAARASFSLDETGQSFFTGGVAGGYGILVLPDYSREYVLGLLNSRLLEWIIRQSATRMRGGYFSFEARFIRGLPIRTIDFSDPADKARHDRMVALVEQMLTLNKQLAAANTDHEKTVLQRQIDATDRQIDQLVYELYGLTDEEIRIVEGTRVQGGVDILRPEK
ncbi:MAG: Eco57I restriction-modification methylase domain-containing protein [Deltaproteobacteria bacterium]|nr:Eco57I restriction-modification methylase domain-containing protein [Deltaproteobacteria bacterium]